MTENIDIAITHDRMRATMTLYSRDTSFEEIKAEMRENRIVEGIKWDDLSEALLNFQNSKDDSLRMIVAQTDKPDPLLRLGNRDIGLTKENCRGLQKDLTAVYRLVGEGTIAEGEARGYADLPVPLPEAVFASKGDVFLREQTQGEFTDVYGVVTTVILSKTPVFKNAGTVDMREKDGWFEFSATCEGYVVMTPKGELHIVSPTVVSPDKMETHFILVPTVIQKEEMLASLYASATTKSDVQAVALPEKEAMTTLFESGKISRILVKKGVPPRQGKDARLSIRINVEKNFSEDALFVDMKSFSSIHEVTEGTLIAEKTPAVAGIGGRNIDGEAVPAKPVNDVLFRAGNHVREEKAGEKIHYIAGLNGVLNLSDKSADISEILQIKNDVGPGTGNIDFSKSIIINGDVMSGYRVCCGRDLIIKGAVNDGAVIVCRGNLSVLKGIHGHTTDLVVKGDAEIGFIQESRVTVNGNLKVQRSIYNSSVFCGGELVVRGKQVDGEKKGSVIGGKIIAMKSMELHSLGSVAGKTMLFCGVNPEVLDKIKALKTAMVSLNKRITRLRSKIGIDLTHPDAAKKLSRLTGEKKEKVREQLLELKNVIGNQEKLQQMLPALREKARNAKPEECVITIRKRIFPDVNIQIGNSSMMVATDESNVQFRLMNNKIILRSGNSIDMVIAYQEH